MCVCTCIYQHWVYVIRVFIIYTQRIKVHWRKYKQNNITIGGRKRVWRNCKCRSLCGSATVIRLTGHPAPSWQFPPLIKPHHTLNTAYLDPSRFCCYLAVHVISFPTRVLCAGTVRLVGLHGFLPHNSMPPWPQWGHLLGGLAHLSRSPSKTGELPTLEPHSVC